LDDLCPYVFIPDIRRVKDYTRLVGKYITGRGKRGAFVRCAISYSLKLSKWYQIVEAVDYNVSSSKNRKALYIHFSHRNDLHGYVNCGLSK